MKRCDGCGNELVFSAQGNWECITEGCDQAAEALRLRSQRRSLLAIPQIFSGIAPEQIHQGDEIGRAHV